MKEKYALTLQKREMRWGVGIEIDWRESTRYFNVRNVGLWKKEIKKKCG